jgi:uncharacterized repeat protein (TIGR01451 family)
VLRAALIAVLFALMWPALAWAPPREANLVARVAFSAQPKAGEVLVVTASVQNRGPDSVLDGTLVTTLPDGLTLVAAHPTQGRCAGATTVSCSFGLLGRFNQAFDHVASVRLLVRAERPGAFSVGATASAPTATETIPDNNTVERPVVVGAYHGVRPQGRVLAKLVSATPRTAVVRVTGLGPDPAQRVVVNGTTIGSLAPGVEHTTTIRFAKARRQYTVTIATATATVRLDVRL